MRKQDSYSLVSILGLSETVALYKMYLVNSTRPSCFHLFLSSQPNWAELNTKRRHERPLLLGPHWSSLAVCSVYLSFYFSKALSAVFPSGRENLKYSACQMLELMPGQVLGLSWWVLARLETFLRRGWLVFGLYWPHIAVLSRAMSIIIPPGLPFICETNLMLNIQDGNRTSVAWSWRQTLRLQNFSSALIRTEDKLLQVKTNIFISNQSCFFYKQLCALPENYKRIIFNLLTSFQILLMMTTGSDWIRRLESFNTAHTLWFHLQAVLPFSGDTSECWREIKPPFRH